MNTQRKTKSPRASLGYLVFSVATASWLSTGTALAAPANDNFADAISLVGNAGNQTGSNNADATAEVSEPAPGNLVMNTVWFKWTSPSDGSFTINTLGSTDGLMAEYDAILGIYSGAAVNALTALPGSPQDTVEAETMTVAVSAGTTYFIQVAGYDNQTANNILLNWSFLAAKSILWDLSSGGAWDSVTQNWRGQLSTLPDTFTDGDAVLFNKIEGGEITIASTVSPFSTTIGADAGNYTFSGASIAGAGSLTKQGSSTVTLSVPNTYTGATTVNAGILVANRNTSINTSTRFTVAAGAELRLTGSTNSMEWFSSAARPLFGAGTVTVTSPGIFDVKVRLNMSAFTGVFNLDGGQFGIQGGAASGMILPTNGTINVGNGTVLYLGWQGESYTANVKLSGVTDNGEGLGVLRSSNATLNGTVILAANTRIGSDDTFNINSVISDDGNGFGFTKISGGTLTLSGTNTYTGPTIVNAGTLVCNSPESLGVGDLNILGKVNLNYTGTRNITELKLNGVVQIGGTYGSTASDATYKNDTYFQGTGTVTAANSSKKDILTFSFGSLGSALISGNAISFTVPFGTNVANLAPTYTLSSGASGSPLSGTTRNFTTPQTYTITAQDMSTKTYTVAVQLGNTLAWNVAGNGDWDFTSTNWLNLQSSLGSIYDNDKQVVFNNPSGGIINITSPVQPQAVIVGADSGDYTFTGESLTGATALTKQGSSTLTLSVANSYTGATTISGGTLVANGNASISTSSSFHVAEGAALQLTGSTAEIRWPSAARPLSGAGAVTVTAPGVFGIGFRFNMTDFTGVLNLNGGQFGIQGGAASGLVLPNTGTINVGNGSVLYLGWVGESYTANVRLSGVTDNGEGLGVLRSSNATLNGTVVLAANTKIGSDDTFIINSVISDGGNAFGFTKISGGSLTLTAANTYTGPTAVNAGALVCNSADSLGSGALSIDGSVNLNFVGNKNVASLTLAGITMPAGVYGSSSSPAPTANQSDSRFSGEGTVTVSAMPGFAIWAGVNAPGQTADQDHDNDGVKNCIEYFMGQSGSSFTPMPTLDNTNTITWPLSAAYNGTYEIQTSPDLIDWTNVSPKPLPTGSNLNYILPSGSNKRFVRLVVTPAP
jgi:fibronectin-binding autotransporter adhesin